MFQLHVNLSHASPHNTYGVYFGFDLSLWIHWKLWFGDKTVNDLQSYCLTATDARFYSIIISVCKFFDLVESHASDKFKFYFSGVITWQNHFKLLLQKKNRVNFGTNLEIHRKAFQKITYFCEYSNDYRQIFMEQVEITCYLPHEIDFPGSLMIYSQFCKELLLYQA